MSVHRKVGAQGDVRQEGGDLWPAHPGRRWLLSGRMNPSIIVVSTHGAVLRTHGADPRRLLSVQAVIGNNKYR